jgi:hypothetical protein
VRIVGSATYLQERARRRLSRGTLLMAGGGVLLLIGVASGFFISGEPPVIANGLPTFLGLGSFIIGILQLYASRRDADAFAGEAPVLAQLRARLDDSYVYLRRVRLPGRLGEADGVLVGPHGVLVLKVAAAAGAFAVRQHTWHLVGGDGQERVWDRSPTWELARPLRNVQRTLLEHGFGDVPVLGAVVLVLGSLVEADQPSAAVVPVDKVGNYVDYLRPETPVPQDRLERVVETLEPYAGGE